MAKLLHLRLADVDLLSTPVECLANHGYEKRSTLIAGDPWLRDSLHWILWYG